MTNGKSLKRALLSSAFSLIICVAMLIGTTFAWFTDTASTAVNKIQSGKLDVAPLLSATYKFKDSVEAYERAAEGRATDVKIVLEME